MPGELIYIGPRRPTLVGGDATQLGHGFNFGGLLRAGAGFLSRLAGPAAAAAPVVTTALTTPGVTAALGKIKPGPIARALGIANPFAPGGVMGGARRRRRLNPLNLRALTRADRRLTRFAQIASRYVHRNAPQRRVHAFKRRRKS